MTAQPRRAAPHQQRCSARLKASQWPEQHIASVVPLSLGMSERSIVADRHANDLGAMSAQGEQVMNAGLQLHQGIAWACAQAGSRQRESQ